MSKRRPLTIEEFRAHVPEWAIRHFDPAIGGDADAAASLIAALPNRMRGDCVRSLFEARVATAALRSSLGMAWDGDYRMVDKAAGSWSRLVKMFKAAEFPIPPLPEIVTVYRGGRAAGLDLGYGASWTLNRGCACWFATRYRHREVDNDALSPLVLSMNVPRDSIVYYSNDRQEEEVIPARLYDMSIDAHPEEWEASAKAWRLKVDDLIGL